jgi:hypothetical protein
MKNLFFISLATISFFACQQTPKSGKADAAQSTFDTTANTQAVEASVRGFFNWYDAFMRAEEFGSDKFNFIDNTGEHLKIKPAELDAFLNEFLKSGAVGKAFIEKEKALYTECEKLWANEPIDEVPSCIDHDRYYCAQEDITEFYKKAKIKVAFDSDQTATATVMLDFGDGATWDRVILVAKEGDKWLVADVNCELGE